MYMDIAVIILLIPLSLGTEVIPACSSNIYCTGPLLDAAQNAYIYDDSKSFVDMKLKVPESEIYEQFSVLQDGASASGMITNDEMRQFVETYFEEPGQEFEEWDPEDWVESPQMLNNIKDDNYRTWASDLNKIWKALGRKMKSDVFLNSDLYSIIPVTNPVIVPGGRFREFYYWDSYWVIKGLLLSDMKSTVKGMLENFMAMVEKYGFVPNGGRIYYTRRSQPPFLSLMVNEYYKATSDIAFVESHISTLRKEYDFWMAERGIIVDGYLLNIYISKINQPRPESYREDKEISDSLPTDEERQEWQSHVTSACESGWDFSTRWAGNAYSAEDEFLPQLQTRNIVPVDLNSILAKTESILSDFYQKIGNATASAEFANFYDNRVNAIENILWNENDGTYYDYSIVSNSHVKRYYASNVNPLWTKCFPDSVNVSERDEKLHLYLKNKGVLDFPGGIPTSKEESGQQWDFPNAWPPLVDMIIEGLETSESELLQNEAHTQAQKWLKSNYKAYNKAGAMFEKFDVTRSDGVAGSGGEYDVQEGFGWTNGVVLSLLDRYGDTATSSSGNLTGGGILCLLVVALQHFIITSL